MTHPRTIVLSGAVTAALVLGACGGDDDGPRVSTATPGTVAAPARTTTAADAPTATDVAPATGAQPGAQSATMERLTRETQASTKRLDRLRREVQSITARVQARELDRAEGAKRIAAISRETRREIVRMTKVVRSAGVVRPSARKDLDEARRRVERGTAQNP